MVRLFVVMGVAGCGKSTIGKGLAAHFGAAYLEGDALHASDNIEKMSRGEPLTDEDRWPWLDSVAAEMAKSEGIVFTGCSALKRAYRERITLGAGEPVTFIHLAGSRELVAERMAAREGHFMPLDLLDSQFATLEAPGTDENAITVDISGNSDAIIAAIVSKLTE